MVPALIIFSPLGMLWAPETIFCLTVICQQEEHNKNLWPCSLNPNDAILQTFHGVCFSSSPSSRPLSLSEAPDVPRADLDLCAESSH